MTHCPLRAMDFHTSRLDSLMGLEWHKEECLKSNVVMEMFDCLQWSLVQFTSNIWVYAHVKVIYYSKKFVGSTSRVYVCKCSPLVKHNLQRLNGCCKHRWGLTSVGPSDHVPDHVTLQGTYPHRGKRKIIFKIALVGDMLVPRRVFILLVHVKKDVWLDDHPN